MLLLLSKGFVAVLVSPVGMDYSKHVKVFDFSQHDSLWIKASKPSVNVYIYRWSGVCSTDSAFD